MGPHSKRCADMADGIQESDRIQQPGKRLQAVRGVARKAGARFECRHATNDGAIAAKGVGAAAFARPGSSGWFSVRKERDHSACIQKIRRLAYCKSAPGPRCVQYLRVVFPLGPSNKDDLATRQFTVLVNPPDFRALSFECDVARHLCKRRPEGEHAVDAPPKSVRGAHRRVAWPIDEGRGLRQKIRFPDNFVRCGVLGSADPPSTRKQDQTYANEGGHPLHTVFWARF